MGGGDAFRTFDWIGSQSDMLFYFTSSKNFEKILSL